jgi:hypothetical protein
MRCVSLLAASGRRHGKMEDQKASWDFLVWENFPIFEY